MLRCHVRYSVYKSVCTPCGAVRERVQPDETHSFDAKTKQGAKRMATEWGGRAVFGKAKWQPQVYNFNPANATVFSKCVEDDGYDLFLVLTFKENTRCT